MVLGYLPFAQGALLRQVSKCFKERVWPNAHNAIVLDEMILRAYVQGGRRRLSQESYAVAPKLISEMTSVSTVTITGLNLTRSFKSDDLLKCFEVLVSSQHGWKISKIVLDSVTIDSIFDAEKFCKKFVNKLTKVKELCIVKCQPMFIEKFLFNVTIPS